MDLKKIGRYVLLITLIVIIALNFVPVHYTVRLFLGSFGFGSGLVLMGIGRKNKYDL